MSPNRPSTENPEAQRGQAAWPEATQLVSGSTGLDPRAQGLLQHHLACPGGWKGLFLGEGGSAGLLTSMSTEDTVWTQSRQTMLGKKHNTAERTLPRGWVAPLYSCFLGKVT